MATDDFRKWKSGQGERCERLFSDAEKEVAANDRGRCDFKGDFTAYSQCKDADKARRVQLVDATARSDCPAYSIGRYGEIPVLVPKHPPGRCPSTPLSRRACTFRFFPFPLWD